MRCHAPSALFVHCWCHQLQLAAVHAAKEHPEVQSLGYASYNLEIFSLFTKTVFQEACRLAGISYSKHALVKGYQGNQDVYFGGLLHRLSEGKCGDIINGLRQMFVSMPPVPGSWAQWSATVKTMGLNPLGEIFIARSGGVVQPLAVLYTDGALAQWLLIEYRLWLLVPNVSTEYRLLDVRTTTKLVYRLIYWYTHAITYFVLLFLFVFFRSCQSIVLVLFLFVFFHLCVVHFLMHMAREVDRLPSGPCTCRYGPETHLILQLWILSRYRQSFITMLNLPNIHILLAMYIHVTNYYVIKNSVTCQTLIISFAKVN